VPQFRIVQPEAALHVASAWQVIEDAVPE